MTEKNLKKMKHFLNNQTAYSDFSEAVNYFKKMERKDQITKQEWDLFFEIILKRQLYSLEQYLLEQYSHLGEQAVLFVPAIVDFETNKYSLQKMSISMLKELIKHAPQKQIKDVLGTAFVLACKNNNILLAKFLLEQGVDDTYCYNKMTGIEAAQKYGEETEDAILYQYLQRNKSNSTVLEDVEKYFVPNALFSLEKDYVPEHKLDNSGLTTEKARKRAIFLTKEYGTEGLLDETTKGEELYLFLKEQYNWDDGFELPYYIAVHKNCELAVALKIFYDAEGIIMLSKIELSPKNTQWEQLLQTIYTRILEGEYQTGKVHYKIPLDEEKRKTLRAQGVEEIFLQDL